MKKTIKPFLTPLYQDLLKLDLHNYIKTSHFGRYCINYGYITEWEKIKQQQQEPTSYSFVEYENVEKYKNIKI